MRGEDTPGREGSRRGPTTGTLGTGVKHQADRPTASRQDTITAGRVGPPLEEDISGWTGAPAGRSVGRRRFGALLMGGFISLTSGCAGILGNSAEDEIMETYREGYSKYTTGADLQNQAVIAYQSDEYATVAQRVQSALEALDAALDSFRSTREVATEAEITPARRIAGAAVRKTELLIEASALLRQTAKGFETGEYEEAQSAYESYRARMAEFEQVDLYPPRALEREMDSGLFDL